MFYHPARFFPLASSSVQVGFYLVMKLTDYRFRIVCGVQRGRLGGDGRAAPPPLPRPYTTVGLGVLPAGGCSGSCLLLARLNGCHRAQTCHFVALNRGSSRCVLRCLNVHIPHACAATWLRLRCPARLRPARAPAAPPRAWSSFKAAPLLLPSKSSPKTFVNHIGPKSPKEKVSKRRRWSCRVEKNT